MGISIRPPITSMYAPDLLSRAAFTAPSSSPAVSTRAATRSAPSQGPRQICITPFCQIVVGPVGVCISLEPWRLRIEQHLHMFQASNEPNHPPADPRDDRKAVHVGESVSLLPYLSAKQCDRTPLCFISASGIRAYPPGKQPEALVGQPVAGLYVKPDHIVMESLAHRD